jgi:mono/diheme cytochrome c family protein
VFAILRRHRAWSQWLAGLLLLAWLLPLGVPHAGDDDLLCAPLGASPDGSARWTRVGGADRQPHHCVICHSIRSFRTALSDSGPAAVSLTAEHGVDALADASRRAPAFDRLPARAPPAQI